MSQTTVTAFLSTCLDQLPRNPPDAEMAARVFGATCGPIALAAVLGTYTCEVMRFFPFFPSRTHTTPTDMDYALQYCGATFERQDRTLPEIGLSFLQLTGPWTNQPGAARHAYLHTHWVATNAGFLYDVNIGDWLERDEWTDHAAQAWCDMVPKATGWRPLRSFALTPQPFQFSPFGRVPLRA